MQISFALSSYFTPCKAPLGAEEVEDETPLATLTLTLTLTHSLTHPLRSTPRDSDRYFNLLDKTWNMVAPSSE